MKGGLPCVRLSDRAAVSDIADYSRASVALPEQQNKLGASSPPSTLTLTPMPNGSMPATSQKSLSGEISKPITPNEENLTSSPVPFPVREPVARENGKDYSIPTQPCGEKDSGASASPDLDLSLWNSLKDLSTEDFEQCLEDWEWRDIKQKLSLSRQREKERRTNVTGSSLLPTPTTYAKGSGNHRPAGSNKLEQSLKPFLGQGDKLNPAAVGWMMGYPPGWVEDILMDGGLSIQLPFIPEYVTIPTTAVPAATSTVNPSLPNKQRSPSNESSTSIPSVTKQPVTRDCSSNEISPSKKSSSKRRRHKGEGSGCIYWRTVIRNGKEYQQAYYHWRENGKRRTRYIPKRLLDRVQEAEAQKLPVADILVLLGGDEKCSSKSSGNSSTSPQDKCSSKTSPPSKKRQQGYGAGYIECKPIKRSGKEYPQYWYHYEFWDKGDRLVKSSKYIPKGKLAQVQQLEEQKAPVREILKVLGVIMSCPSL